MSAGCARARPRSSRGRQRSIARAVMSSASSRRTAGVGDDAGAGEKLFGFAADVGGVPRRPARTQPGQHLATARVTVDRPAMG